MRIPKVIAVKKLLLALLVIIGSNGFGCGEFKDPFIGDWGGEQGSRMIFKNNNLFLWQKPNGVQVTGSYVADVKFPHHLDLYTGKRHYKCAITTLRGYGKKRILICFGKDRYPLILDFEKGEIFTARK